MNPSHSVLLGTPLIKQKSQDHKKKNIHTQEVVDDQGRVRLHGAFQGGFSAGYYMSVGSKEGWQPKNFKTSRTGERAFDNATPFDFMDDEDIKELGGVSIITEKYDELGSTARELGRNRILESNNIGNVSVIVQRSDSAKVLLKAMEDRFIKNTGIKSQEIAEYTPFKEYLEKLHNGISLHNTYGRGYDPLVNAPEFKQAKVEKMQSRHDLRKNLPTGGFGTGIFEEDDEIALYEVPESNYDDVLEDERSSMISKLAASGGSMKPRSNYLMKDKFKIVNIPLKPSRLYLAPMPPSNFQPNPPFLSVSTGPVLQSKTASISSYLAQKNKERVNKFLTQSLKTDDGPKPIVTASKGPIPIFTVPPKVAEAALEGFMPFSNDLVKQARYKRFLKQILEKEGAEENNEIFEEVKLSQDEAIETREFAKAAMLFRPHSNMIANRFINEWDGKKALKEEKKPDRIYGKNTRSMEKWQPCKVLCRRFAIGYHQQEGLDENDELQKLALNPDTMDQLEKERDMLLESGRLQGTQDEVELLVVNQNEMKAEDATTNIEENIDEEEEVIEKPSMDLFKAIFADSDDEQVEEIASKHVEEIVAPPPIKTAEPASTSATATLDTLDINFRPVFTKPTKRTSNMSLNKPRQKKVKSRPIVSLNEEEEMEPQETKMKTSKFRPSAEDFM